MCGRYTIRTPGHVMTRLFHLGGETTPLLPRYNVAPTQAAPVVRQVEAGGPRTLAYLHWGLLPSWAKDRSFMARSINARSETAAEKPTFRAAMRQRRCLVPADGFFEWRAEGKKKQPFLITLGDETPFAFAGLWEHWEAEDGERVETFTVLTTEANETLRPLHERMPVILAERDHAAWLDPAQRDVAALSPLLRPFTEAPMKFTAVDAWVNNARHDDPRCVRPLERADGDSALFVSE